MRLEIIRCDTCKKEHNAEYELPRDWIHTIQNTGTYALQEERHFCSLACLRTWLNAQLTANDIEVS